MLNLINSIVARAKADRQRIVLPEGTEERTIQAADQIIGEGIARIILIGNQIHPFYFYIPHVSRSRFR